MYYLGQLNHSDAFVVKWNLQKSFSRVVDLSNFFCFVSLKLAKSLIIREIYLEIFLFYE